MSKPIVLVVENDDEVRDLMVYMLKSLDCEIDTARDGEEALQKVNSLLPDIVVLDLNLPYINGVDILKHIRNHPDLVYTRVIVVTSYSQIQTAPILDMIDYIFHKPYIMTDFRSVMRDLLMPDA